MSPHFFVSPHFVRITTGKTEIAKEHEHPHPLSKGKNELSNANGTTTARLLTPTFF